MPEQTPDPNEPIDAEIVPDPAPSTTPSAQPVPAPYTVPPTEDWTPPVVATDYTDGGVPTLDYVRDKIEGRAATAQGWQELAGGTEQVQTAEEKLAEREQKGKDKLAEIRKQMGL